MTKTLNISLRKKWRAFLSYSVKWHEKAVEDLKGVDKKSAKGLMERLKNYLPEDPLSLGTPLKGIFKGLYRYRFGDYRVIDSMTEKKIPS